MRIDAANPRRFGPPTRRIKVDDLRSRVDARVRATCGNDARGRVGNRADRVLERILDAAARRLRLKAAERAAVVFEGERVAR